MVKVSSFLRMIFLQRFRDRRKMTFLRSSNRDDSTRCRYYKGNKYSKILKKQKTIFRSKWNTLYPNHRLVSIRWKINQWRQIRLYKHRQQQIASRRSFWIQPKIVLIKQKACITCEKYLTTHGSHPFCLIKYSLDYTHMHLVSNIKVF